MRGVNGRPPESSRHLRRSRRNRSWRALAGFPARDGPAIPRPRHRPRSHRRTKLPRIGRRDRRGAMGERSRGRFRRNAGEARRMGLARCPGPIAGRSRRGSCVGFIALTSNAALRRTRRPRRAPASRRCHRGRLRRPRRPAATTTPAPCRDGRAHRAAASPTAMSASAASVARHGRAGRPAPTGRARRRRSTGRENPRPR